MKLVLAALAGFFCVALAPLRAQEAGSSLSASTPDMKAALSQVVSRQLDAFAAGDFTKAYAFASSGIQKIFPAPAFEKMVRASYPIMLTGPRVDFGIAVDDGQQAILFVEMTGPNGRQVFRYHLTHESAGWRISGVEQDEKTPPTRPPLTA